MTTNKLIGIVLIVAIVIVIAFAILRTSVPAQMSGTPINSVKYSCDAGKTISVQYYQKSATVSLSDGRNFDLNQSVSADGARYANADESFVFWSKGNGALVLENNTQKSYTGCIALASDAMAPGLPQSYSNSDDGFSIRLPDDYSVNESYKYQALGPGKDISGVKFTVPASMASSTNLSSDTYVSVEEIPQAKSCTAGLFLSQTNSVRISTLTEGDTTYSFASSTDAAAGNRYEESVYAIPGTNPCIAVRYFVHYGVIQNYPAGAVSEFDRQSLLSQFDSIRKSLVVVQ